MPGNLVQTGATGICSHGGQVLVVGTGARVLLSGMPAATSNDTHPIAGCAFNVSGAPVPCLTAAQFVPAVRVLIQGQPALLNTAIGMAKNAAQAPQGTASIVSAQPRVVGT